MWIPEANIISKVKVSEVGVGEPSGTSREISQNPCVYKTVKEVLSILTGVPSTQDMHIKALCC